MLKILQVRLQQYVNGELPDVQTGFRKGRGTRDQIANIHWILGKKREFQENIYFCFIDYGKAFDCMITTNCGKFLKRWEYQITLIASWKTCMQVKKKQSDPDVEQQIASKLGKEYIKGVHYHSAYLTSLQSTSHEISSWMNHKLEPRLPGEISATSDTKMIPLEWQKVKRN